MLLDYNSGLGLEQEIILCSMKPESLLSLSWDGEVNMNRTQGFNEMTLYGGSVPGTIFTNCTYRDHPQIIYIIVVI
jgi:hypothetical protein